MSEETAPGVVQMTCNQVRKNFSALIDETKSGKTVECLKYQTLVMKVVGPDVLGLPAGPDVKAFVRGAVSILEVLETPTESRTAKVAARQALSELADSIPDGVEEPDAEEG